MRLLPQIHPADRAAITAQAMSVLSISATVGLMASATASPVASVGAAFGAAALNVGGLVCARTAGARSARRALNDHEAAKQRHRDAAARDPELPWLIDGVDGPAEPAAAPVAEPAAERVLVDAGGGKAVALGRMIEELPEGAAVAIGPEDSRWLPAVRRLAVELATEIRPSDLQGMAGRGVIELADTVGRRVPELDEETVLAFTGDYVMVRAGLQPTSGRDWRGALAAQVVGPEDPRWEPSVRRLAEVLLGEIRPEDGRSIGARGIRVLAEAVRPRVPELPLRVVQDYVRDYINVRNGDRQDGDWYGLLAGLSAEKRDALLVDLVTAGGPGGISLAALAERVDRLGASDAHGTAWVFPAVGGLINRRALTFSGVKYQIRGGDDATGPIVGPGDSRWAPAVRRLVAALAAELRPEDSSPLAGRGTSQIARAVAARVPELDKATAVAFVRDYMEVRSGCAPKSGRQWREAMCEVPDVSAVFAVFVRDVVRAAGPRGITAGAVAERLDALGIGEPCEVEGVLGALAEDGAVVCTDYRWRPAHLDWSAV